MNVCAEPAGILLPYFDREDCLVYGIGNDGRQDDGLGWAFMDWLEARGLCQRAERRRLYQLQLEDADLLSYQRRVLFVDASKGHDLDTFRISRVHPRLDFSFTSHALSIAAVLATCMTCFDRVPEVYQLAIRGYEWELQSGLSAGALENLALAQAAISGSDETVAAAQHHLNAY
jgi:hydrogenase maturation protease